MSRLVRFYPRAWRDRYEDEFIALLEGKPEDEVFVKDEEEAKPPEAPAVEEKGTAREGPKPRPRPRPGLAGGGAEMRANDS